MNDLHDLMYRASDGDPNRSADPTTLLRRGRRRVYRRRGITAVGGAAAVSLVVAGGIAWLPSATPDRAPNPDGQPPIVSGRGHTDDGADGRVEVSRAEVERRCTIANHNTYGDNLPNFVIYPGDEGPWYEGQQVRSKDYVHNQSFGNLSVFSMDCRIPEAAYADSAGRIDAPLPSADDPASLRDACSQYAGMDLSDWTVLTAAGGRDLAGGALRSPDGRMATCVLATSGAPLGAWPRLSFTRDGTQPYDGRGDYEVWLDCGRDRDAGADVFACLDVNWLPGPRQASRIVLTDGDGTTYQIPVVDGWYAFSGRIVDHKATESPGDLHFTVYAPDGSVLADYDESDLPPKAWDES